VDRLAVKNILKFMLFIGRDYFFIMIERLFLGLTINLEWFILLFEGNFS